MSTTPDLPDELARFVAEVRAHLADLPPEQVDDLTGGLEANLAEGLADDDTVRPPWMGDAAAFADELRTAAGLPPRDPDGGRRRAGPLLRRRGTALARRVAARTRSSSWGRWTEGLAVLLRPAWWVLRAVVAVVVLGGLFLAGASAGVLITLLILPFAIYASVELGRGRWTFPWRRAAVIAGNTLTGIGAVALGLTLFTRTTAPTSFETVVTRTLLDGVWVNGNRAVNLFPYDAQGRPLRDVQLFDQDGNPVDIGQLRRAYAVTPDGAVHELVPATDATGRQRWNTYPLRSTVIKRGIDPDTGLPGPRPAGPPADAVPPLIAVPSIQAPGNSPIPTATPSLTPP